MQDITYCLSCKKDMRNIDPKVIKTKTNKRVIISNILFTVIKSQHLFRKDLVCSIV